MEEIKEILTLSFDPVYAYYANKSFASLEDALIAEDEARKVGVINWKVFSVGDDMLGYLYWVAVHPNHRRKGIGEGLIMEAIQRIQEEAGPVDVFAATEKHNQSMQKLFLKIGFTSTGRSVIKKKYGVKRFRIYSQMMLMPNENLYVKFKSKAPGE